MAAPDPISLSWGLQQTSTELISVSRGILEAATSDNVQPIALLACEGFGATLPTSTVSYNKVLQLCCRAYDSAVLNFVKITIGYRRGDSGWQLCQSDAGVRFLALAACLITCDDWTAAEALKDLIHDTAVDKKMVPTTRQLQQLLGALQSRLSLSGFADSVVGWSLWLGSITDYQCHQERKIWTPSKVVITKLVTAMCRLSRLGSTHSITIRSPLKDAAWVIAFTKWLSGLPPSVAMVGTNAILEQARSRVFIEVLPANSTETMQISSFDELGNIVALVNDKSEGTPFMHGMVSIKTYTAEQMDEFGQIGTKNRDLIVRNLATCCQLVSDKVTALLHPAKVATDSIIATGRVKIAYTAIFPQMKQVPHIFEHLVGLDPQNYQLTHESKDVSFIDSLAMMMCGCSQCGNASGDNSRLFICQYPMMLRQLAGCIFDVLVLSLLARENDTTVHLKFHHYQFIGNVMDSLETANGDHPRMEDILVGSTNDIIRHICSQMFYMIGADSPHGGKLASSAYGQTMYYEFLEHLGNTYESPLRLTCVPGCLSWEGESYAELVEAGIYADSLQKASREQLISHETLTGTNLAHPWESKFAWKIGARDTYLTAHLTAVAFRGNQSLFAITGIYTMLRAYFIDCVHGRTASKLSPIWESVYTIPLTATEFRLPEERTKDEVWIIQTATTEARFLALCTERSIEKDGRPVPDDRPIIVARRGCLDCCIDVCRKLGLSFVIF